MPKFLGEIQPNAGDFTLLDSQYIRGGFKQVDSLIDRDNILPDKLTQGTFVYVREENKIYKYINGQWEPFKTGEGNGINYGYLSTHQTVNRVTVLPIESIIEIEFEEPSKFNTNDIIGWDISDNLNGFYTEVKHVSDGKLYIDLIDTPPIKGDVIQLCGNTTKNPHSTVLALHNSEGNTVISQFQNTSVDSLNDNCLFRLGKISNSEWSIYGKQVYFKGIFIDQNGNSLNDQAFANRALIDRSMKELKRELNKDNLFEDPYFTHDAKYWHSQTIIAPIRVNKQNYKWVKSLGVLFSRRYAGGAISHKDNETSYKVVKSNVKGELKKISPFSEPSFPSWYTLVLEYFVEKSGSLTIKITGPGNYNNIVLSNQQIDVTTGDKYCTLRKYIKLTNPVDIFELYFTGVIYLRSFRLEVNEIKNISLGK